MRELAKSIGSFSWALSLFGVQQLVNLAKQPVPGPGHQATADLDAVTPAVEQRLGGSFKRSFAAGDRWQRNVTDLVYGVATFEIRDPKKLGQLTVDVVQKSTTVLKSLLP